MVTVTTVLGFHLTTAALYLPHERAGHLPHHIDDRRRTLADAARCVEGLFRVAAMVSADISHHRFCDDSEG